MSHPVVRNDRGAPTQLLAIVQDMTHQRGLEWTLHRSRALIDAAVATLPGTEITKDRGVIDALRAALAGAESTSRSLINGNVYLTLNAPMRDDAGAIVGVNSVNNNITAEVSADMDRQHKDAVRSFAARHDPLTGLLGRSGLVEHLGELAFSNSRPGALILIDLDDFNLVNDSLGNTIGDAVLLEVACRVSGAFPGVVMARYGADAFAIVAPLGVSQVEALDAAERVRAALDPPVEIFGHTLRITASQGIALEETRGLSTLLRDADSALAHAQLDGNGQCRF